MNQKDKDLLNLIQFNFPITEKPFKSLAQKLNLTEEQVIKKIQSLKKKKIIRRIGGIFESKKMKFESVLVAAKVPTNKIKKFAKVVSGYREATHCYLRSHIYNVWFTLTCKNKKEQKMLCANISKLTGIADLLLLPALQKFKVDTRFRL